MNNIIVGPYIGSWETELFEFYPFTNWIKKVFNNENIFINTHYNRDFLYNQNANFIPVYEHLTGDEVNQKGPTHSEVSQKDYIFCVKKIKTIIAEKYKCHKKDIFIYNLTYSKFFTPFSIYQKIYKKIIVPQINITSKNNIIFIPEKKSNIHKIEKIYNFLIKENYNPIVIGDLKIHFPELNHLLQYEDFINSVYKYIINYINSAKMIITPLSHWTLLANLQQIPVFSWGKNVGTFKQNYNFQKNCNLIYNDKDTNINIILNQLKYVLNKEIL